MNHEDQKGARNTDKRATNANVSLRHVDLIVIEVTDDCSSNGTEESTGESCYGRPSLVKLIMLGIGLLEEFVCEYGDGDCLEGSHTSC